MKIGVAKEIKRDEYRVALTPAGALELARRGHDVTIETGAGVGSAFADAAYEAVGARIASVDDVWGDSELLLKVKEPIAAVAYETVETDDRRLPLLAPMSEVAGRLAAQAGAYFLEKPLGGRGLLVGGVAGVALGEIVVIGGGIVG